MISIEDLKEHGKVEVCILSENKLIIKITKGFSGNAIETFKLMKKIDILTQGLYPIIEKCITDKNMFDIVLKIK